METTAATEPISWSSSLLWLRSFLRDELAPYPGRAALVARMVVAASIVMLLDMTFKIPYGAYAAMYALTTSRDSPEATLRSVKTTVMGFAIAAAYVLMGGALFSSEPALRVVWVLASLFLMFFLMSTATNHLAAARFGYLVAITLTLWDSQLRSEQKVVGTLWAIGSLSLANVIVVVIELVYIRLYPVDQLTAALTERLQCSASVLRSMGQGATNESTERRIAQLAVLGTSRMRRDLLRSDGSSESREQSSAVIALVGRLVDLGANLTHFSAQTSPAVRRRFDQLAQRIEALSDSLFGSQPDTGPKVVDMPAPLGMPPLLLEMEDTVSAIAAVAAGSKSPGGYYLPRDRLEPPKRLLVSDAFSSSDHVKFGIRGGLAAGVCYLAYNLIAWPGISTAVTTCLLTALTTVGASRQKQILRFSGALVGGVILGFGAQVFLLPAIDSIAGFLILFLAVTIPAAWVAASGPRLSYFGVQVALAFYLINLQEFKFQVSLTIARDRVAGILLGLLAMWLVFDRLWGAPAVAEMERTFVSNLRLLGKMMRAPASPNVSEAIDEIDSLRETINANFDRLRQQADGVMVEFGPSRERNLRLRSQILDWQLQLRVLFILRTALLKYRLRLSGFETPEPVRVAQQALDMQFADQIEDMADRLSGKPVANRQSSEPLLLALEQTIQSSCPTELPECLLALRSLSPLCHQVESILSSLDQQMFCS